MSVSDPAASAYLLDFLSQANAAKSLPRDPLLNRLLFGHAISLMEKYLSDLLIAEIRSNASALKRLADTPKFRDQCLPIPMALNVSVGDYLVRAMQNEVWHRLNDVAVFYRAALRIDFQIPGSLRDAIAKRHHIVHRNGTDLQGMSVEVTDAELLGLYGEFSRFLNGIDAKYREIKEA